jgi:predicted nucleic acid-binding protein
VIWLLDVSTLLARLIPNHQHFRRVIDWWPGRTLAVCPITELGFLRVSSNLSFTMEEARRTLGTFLVEQNPLFVPCDRRALESAFTAPRQSTDMYLADLAASRGWRLATLDEKIVHDAVELIPK